MNSVMKITEDLVSKIIRPRHRQTHKGDYGRVLLIGGLYPYGGAIIMAAIATVRSGAGLVTVATDRENISALHSHLPEAMAFDVTDTQTLARCLAQADVILIGSGLNETPQSQGIFEQVLQSAQPHQTLIIDGSGLNLLARILARCDKSKIGNYPLILTPHQREWERLSGLAIDQQTPENTQTQLRQFPQNTILVAKSSATKIYQGDNIAEIGVGGAYQATGGMGDTLCGMIAGFVAQFRENLFETVTVATFLHSYIAEQLSPNAYVVLPTEISREIPRVMKYFSDKS